MENFSNPLITSMESKKEMLNEVQPIFLGLGNLIETIALSEYSHARNAIDPQHAEKLKSDKVDVLNQLHDLRKKYEVLYKYIAKVK